MFDSFYQALIDNAPDPVLVCDPSWRVVYSNRSAGSSFGWRPERLRAQTLAELCVEPFDAAILQAGAEAGEGSEQVLALRHADGGIVATITRGIALRLPSGEQFVALYLYPLASDRPRLESGQGVSDLLTSLRGYRHMALTDALTGLPNRRALNDALERECARAARQGTFVSVIMIDLDGFKRINDRFGHVAGDEILRRYAQLLRGLMRRSDFLGRYGGDEMLMVIPELPSGAWSYAERLRVAVAAQALEPAWGRATVSAGIASKRPTPRDSSTLVEQADAMLYEAKRAGGNRVRLIVL